MKVDSMLGMETMTLSSGFCANGLKETTAIFEAGFTIFSGLLKELSAADSKESVFEFLS